MVFLNSKFLDWYFRVGSTNSKVNEYQFKSLPIPSFVDSADLNIDLTALINREKWRELENELMSSLKAPGILSSAVSKALVQLCKRLQKLESERIMKSRSERSHLADQSQKIQDLFDNVLYKAYGLSEEEASYVENRLTQML